MPGVCSVRPTGLVAKVERREALRPTSLGARGSPCRARWVRYSRLRGARWYPGASRRSTPSLGFARDSQTSDPSRRENKKPWLFEIRNTDHVSRARCGILHAASQNRDPGFFEPRASWAPALQRTAPQVLRAALRPGNGYTSPRLRGDDAVVGDSLTSCAQKKPELAPGLSAC